MQTIYIDSTLKHDWNVKFNPELCAALEEQGFTCYLPQRNTDQAGSREGVFQQNTSGIRDADVLLAVASNESPNWGVEVGYAYGLGKKIVALATTEHPIPLMAKYMMNDVVETEDLDDIPSYIERLTAAIKAT